MCFNGGACDTSLDPPACVCSGGALYLNGNTWMGPTCEDRPACSFCGADEYCGLEPNCDPSDPPVAVVAELTFPVDIESVGAEGTETRARFESDFADDVSTALGISAENIIVISITGGSITIEFAIVPDSNFQIVDGGDGQFAFDPAERLTQLAAMVDDPESALYTTEGSTFAELGEPTNTPVAIPIELLDDSGKFGERRQYPVDFTVFCSPRTCFRIMHSTLCTSFKTLGYLQRQAIRGRCVFGPQLHGCSRGSSCCGSRWLRRR
jgi:hypothetical protein